MENHDVYEMDHVQAKAEFIAILEKLGVTLAAKFVPFSQSRNRGNDNHKSINWLIDVKRADRVILKGVEYGAGIAHIPGYQAISAALAGTQAAARYFGRVVESGEYMPALAADCKTNRARALSLAYGQSWGKLADLPPPELASVMGCLFMDCDVLNYAKFEEWAESLGFDPDSRKAEGIYRACLEQALTLKNSIPHAEFERLCALASQL